MFPVIDYYFAPQSPWAYLGHASFATLARDAKARINVLPVNIGAVFAVSGGLPLGQRSAQRQAYRLTELARFSSQLAVPLNLAPRHFPVAGDDAARLIIAVELGDGADAAMTLAGALGRAVWAEERDIAAADELAELLAACALPAQRLAEAGSAAVQARYAANTQRAIAAGVFGAPTYVVDGELFWGQDRLEFVRRRLAL